MSDGERDNQSSASATYIVDEDRSGQRLDVFVNEMAGWNSRGRIKEAIKCGEILVAGSHSKPSYKVRVGEEVQIHDVSPLRDEPLLAEDIAIGVLFEDPSMIVLNKAPYISVHPGAGNRTGTLANALAFHFQALSDVSGPERPGIVHRLDRDTSGVICIAKTNRAHYAIATQFQERTVAKTYEAIVEGVMEFDQYKVDEPIGRHPSQPTKMAVVASGRSAFTEFKVLERYDGFTHVRCFPKSGRTHQIRVHLAHLGHPIICDKHYGRRQRISYGDLAHLSLGDPENRILLDRQALHAKSLSLEHPLRGERMTFEAPISADIQSVIDALKETKRSDSKSK